MYIYFFEIQTLKYQVITITPSRERLDNMQWKNFGFLGYTDIQSAPEKSWICIWGSFEAGNVSRVSISISEVSAPYLVFAC